VLGRWSRTVLRSRGTRCSSPHGSGAARFESPAVHARLSRPALRSASRRAARTVIASTRYRVGWPAAAAAVAPAFLLAAVSGVQSRLKLSNQAQHGELAQARCASADGSRALITCAWRSACPVTLVCRRVSSTEMLSGLLPCSHRPDIGCLTGCCANGPVCSFLAGHVVCAVSALRYSCALFRSTRQSNWPASISLLDAWQDCGGWTAWVFPFFSFIAEYVRLGHNGRVGIWSTEMSCLYRRFVKIPEAVKRATKVNRFHETATLRIDVF